MRIYVDSWMYQYFCCEVAKSVIKIGRGFSWYGFGPNEKINLKKKVLKKQHKERPEYH